jgi:hypothetical protein
MAEACSEGKERGIINGFNLWTEIHCVNEETPSTNQLFFFIPNGINGFMDFRL